MLQGFLYRWWHSHSRKCQVLRLWIMSVETLVGWDYGIQNPKYMVSFGQHHLWHSLLKWSSSPILTDPCLSQLASCGTGELHSVIVGPRWPMWFQCTQWLSHDGPCDLPVLSDGLCFYWISIYKRSTLFLGIRKQYFPRWINYLKCGIF